MWCRHTHTKPCPDTSPSKLYTHSLKRIHTSTHIRAYLYAFGAAFSGGADDERVLFFSSSSYVQVQVPKLMQEYSKVRNVFGTCKFNSQLGTAHVHIHIYKDKHHTLSQYLSWGHAFSQTVLNAVITQPALAGNTGAWADCVHARPQTLTEKWGLHYPHHTRIICIVLRISYACILMRIFIFTLIFIRGYKSMIIEVPAPVS